MASKTIFTDDKDNILDCTLIGNNAVDITIYQQENIGLANNIVLGKNELTNLINELKRLEAMLTD